MSSSKALSSENPVVEIRKGACGLEKVILRDFSGYSAEVSLYGGQVTSWKNARGDEFLFVSSKSAFKPSVPIRGGIPLCFPQFSSLRFARKRFWIIDLSPPPLPKKSSSDRTFVDLLLKSTENMIRTFWPPSEVRGEGSETMDYLDNLRKKERFTEQGDAITSESEEDKVYLSTTTKIVVLDHAKKQTLVIHKEGLPTT